MSRVVPALKGLVVSRCVPDVMYVNKVMCRHKESKSKSAKVNHCRF
jgi:hypothetical protein